VDTKIINKFINAYMKFLAALILTVLLSFIAGLYLPWWGIAIAAFVVALIVYQNAGMAFLAAFAGLLLLWSGLAFWIDSGNESILSARIGELLGIGNNAFLLILITGAIGGLVAGFAAMSGSFLRSSKVKS
jgi:hypothetical protein